MNDEVPVGTVENRTTPVFGSTPGNASPGQRMFWRVPTAAFLLIAAVALLALLRPPQQYTAEALLMIEGSAPYIAFVEVAKDREIDRFVQTQLELIRSVAVLDSVLAQPNIARQPAIMAAADGLSYLRDRLKIRRLGNAELYRVTFRGEHPEDAAEVVNAVVNRYLSVQSSAESDQFQRVVDLLEKERQQCILVVEDLRQRVVALSTEVTGRNPLSGASVDDESNEEVLNGLRGRIRDVRIDQAADEATVTFLKEKRNPVDVSAGDEQSGETGPPASPVPDDASTDAIADDKALAALQIRQVRLNAEEKFLAKEIKRREANSRQRNSKAIELEFAKGELAREERVFELVAARILMMRTESERPARVKLRQAAASPLAADPRPWLSGNAAAPAALLALAVYALGRPAGRRRREPKMAVWGEAKGTGPIDTSGR